MVCIRLICVAMTLLEFVSITQAADELLAGIATVDITPAPGQMLWGYTTRTHAATGTLDPLMAKAVVLKAGDKSAAIETLDLGRTPEDATLAKNRARETAESRIVNLFITASHTHLAPVMDTPPG